MLELQQTISFSDYSSLYDLIIPKDNLLRQITDLVDFSFVYQELQDKYCHDNGRTAESPIRMFKYLLLKVIYNISDVDVVERTRYDMSFMYFLGLTPEETNLINPSSLTKFRRLRLKDMDLLDQFHAVIYRINDLDYGLAIILQTLCCTDRVGTRMCMGCINNDGSRLEDTCFYSNRNSLLDKKIQQVHILQAKSTEFGQGTRINQIGLLRS